MRKAIPILLVLAAVALTGCVDDTTAPRDVTPPAAPRGVFSVTGDGQVTLRWFANTESDVVGYRIYEAPCASGSSCPYDRVGTTSATQFVVTGLANGITRFYAVSAVDRAGNESPLSLDAVFDTPRPAGTATLNNFASSASGSEWDFSAFGTRAYPDSTADILYGNNGIIHEMFAVNFDTNIQDAGYASSLDAVDFAPLSGWSPTGSVELIVGHCYVVWTRDDHYAKFRVSGLSSSQATFDWAYQTDTGNPELHARPAHHGAPVPRPIVWLRT